MLFKIGGKKLWVMSTVKPPKGTPNSSQPPYNKQNDLPRGQPPYKGQKSCPKGLEASLYAPGHGQDREKCKAPQDCMGLVM